MKMIIQGGKLVDNRADVTLVNNTALTRTLTVPTGVRWQVLGGHTKNGDNVTRDVNIEIRDAANHTLMYLLEEAALGVNLAATFPNNEVGLNNWSGGNLLLVTGQKILFYFKEGGASAGGTGTTALMVLETRVA